MHRGIISANNVLSESVGMCRPLDPPFSPQAHPLVGYTDVKNTPIGYIFFILSHSLWVIFVKFSYLATLLGLFCKNLIRRLGVKFTPRILRLGWKFTPRTPHPYPFWGEVPIPGGFLRFTCPSGTWIWKSACPAKIFTCPANICTSSVKVMNTAGKISTCPDWKTTCPDGHITTTVYVPWDKICMPQACGHTLMSSPAESLNLSRSHRALNKLSQNLHE